MHNARMREMTAGETLHPSPRPTTATTLTAAADYFQPKTSYFVDEMAVPPNKSCHMEIDELYLCA